MSRRTPAAQAYRAQRPDRSRSWRDTDLCVIDLEMTGLDPTRDHIVSIGTVPIRHGRIRAGEATYSRVRPERDVPGESTRIHTLREADLADAPSITVCAERLLETMTGHVLVAHAAWIEEAFLNRVFRRLGTRVHRPVLDTAGMAARLPELPQVPGHALSLEHAAERLDLPVHTPHHALGDAMTTAQLFLVLATRLGRTRDLTIGELARLSKS